MYNDDKNNITRYLTEVHASDSRGKWPETNAHVTASITCRLSTRVRIAYTYDTRRTWRVYERDGNIITHSLLVYIIIYRVIMCEYTYQKQQRYTRDVENYRRFFDHSV